MLRGRGGRPARERALAGGSAPGDGPLRGVPTAIKDLNLTAGVRTTFGSAAYDDFVPEVSDGVVQLMGADGNTDRGTVKDGTLVFRLGTLVRQQ